jgi:hypothetical protein
VILFFHIFCFSWLISFSFFIFHSMIVFCYLFIIIFPFLSLSQLNRLPVLIPSEYYFQPVGAIMNIIQEYNTIFVNSSLRVTSEIANQILKNCSDLIDRCASPNIMSRSASNSNLTSELHASLLENVKNARVEIARLFQEITPLIASAALALKSGYGTILLA